MTYREIKFQDLPKHVRSELNIEYCGGWISPEHAETKLHFVVPSSQKITEHDVMIFCANCLRDFWSNKPI